MRNDHTTILLVTSGAKGAKSLRFKTSHIRFALYAFLGFTLISLMSFVSTLKFYSEAEILAHQKRESITKLLSTINILNQDFSKNKILETKLRQKLKDIEKKLIEIQELLDKKGIKKELSVGGEFIPADRLSLSYVEFLGKDINELFYTMKTHPVGTPLSGKINSGFGYRKDPFKSRLAFHSGIDLDASYGQLVVATADGVVKHAGWYQSYGKTVIIKHKDGYETLYSHLSKVKVKEKQKVKTGDVIGSAGTTGRSKGTHLHYEVIKDGKKLNPTKFLSLK